MSGIAVVHAHRPNPDLLASMLLSLRHRAPIASGLFGDRRAGPARIAFSGRLFNRKALHEGFAERLPGSLSDGDLVLRLYERDRERCVDSLDGVYAFVIDDPEAGPFAARDPMGCQPLYIGTKGDQTLFVSEMKAFPKDTVHFAAFPPGCTHRPGEGFRRRPDTESAAEPDADGAAGARSSEQLRDRLVEMLDRAVERRIRGRTRVGVLLSGGLDSSIVAALASRHLPCVDTFSVGTADSDDLAYARLCAEHLGTRHRELVYDRGVCLSVLPDVIRSLESFDPLLVRSAVPNYLAARLALGAADFLLSGEGADELFAGYAYLLAMPPVQRDAEMRMLLSTLHGTGLQRGDRMAAAFGMEVHAPFLDTDFRRFALSIPVAEKTGPAGEEKWPLRQAFADILPDGIIRRPKAKFSVGAGSSLFLAEWAEATITDEELAAEARSADGRELTGKEELLYYRIFKEYYPSVHAERAIGFTRGA